MFNGTGLALGVNSISSKTSGFCKSSTVPDVVEDAADVEDKDGCPKFISTPSNIGFLAYDFLELHILQNLY